MQSLAQAVALARLNAAACETARHPRCVCHCGGRLHGIQHLDADIVAAAQAASGAEEFEVLAELNAQRQRAETLQSQLSLGGENGTV